MKSLHYISFGGTLFNKPCRNPWWRADDEHALNSRTAYSHYYYASSERAHVSITGVEAACYRLEKALVGCADHQCPSILPHKKKKKWMSHRCYTGQSPQSVFAKHP